MTEARTLVVENDPALRQRLYRALLDAEIFSDCASDAGEALDMLRARHYAIVILDIGIVGGSEAVIAAVQGMPAAEQPIVIATAETERIRHLDAEAVQVVLRRPVRVREVAELARACIDTSAARRRAVAVHSERSEESA